MGLVDRLKREVLVLQTGRQPLGDHPREDLLEEALEAVAHVLDLVLLGPLDEAAGVAVGEQELPGPLAHAPGDPVDVRLVGLERPVRCELELVREGPAEPQVDLVRLHPFVVAGVIEAEHADGRFILDPELPDGHLPRYGDRRQRGAERHEAQLAGLRARLDVPRLNGDPDLPRRERLDEERAEPVQLDQRHCQPVLLLRQVVGLPAEQLRLVDGELLDGRIEPRSRPADLAGQRPVKLELDRLVGEVRHVDRDVLVLVLRGGDPQRRRARQPRRHGRRPGGDVGRARPDDERRRRLEPGHGLVEVLPLLPQGRVGRPLLQAAQQRLGGGRCGGRLDLLASKALVEGRAGFRLGADGVQAPPDPRGGRQHLRHVKRHARAGQR